jgi:hypothetical protein
MPVPVVNIRVMGMAVLDGQVCMSVTVFAGVTCIQPMGVLMVPIVFMFVLVFQPFVLVLMGVVFREMQPHAQAHQHGSNPECHRRRF